MMIRWRGRRALGKPEQVGNACDFMVNLTPASESPALQVKSRWAALLPGQEVPLIGEVSYARQEEC